MRLEKHTEEEIELAKKESGIVTQPNEEQMQEWIKIHEDLNLKLAKNEANYLNGRIVDMQKVVLPHLDGRALHIARTKGYSTVLEILKNNKSGFCFPWHKSDIEGYEYITDEALAGGDFSVCTVLCRYMTKLIEINVGDTLTLSHYVKRFALTFAKLAYHNKISYGIFGPFMALPLADVKAESDYNKALRVAQEAGARLTSEKLKELDEAKKRTHKEAKTRRILLMVYPYSHFETEELNEWLGNDAFVEEGALGSDDWSGLPEG